MDRQRQDGVMIEALHSGDNGTDAALAELIDHVSATMVW